MVEQILYSDRLVEISNNSILLRNYYVPFGNPKRIPMNTIERIDVKEPTLFTGRWRLQGSGDFRVWFPLDLARPTRDKVFIITFAKKRIRAGFTVEDSQTVLRILKDKGLIKQTGASQRAAGEGQHLE